MLPLDLGRKPSPLPRAVRLRIIPCYLGDGMIGRRSRSVGPERMVPCGALHQPPAPLFGVQDGGVAKLLGLRAVSGGLDKCTKRSGRHRMPVEVERVDRRPKHGPFIGLPRVGPDARLAPGNEDHAGRDVCGIRRGGLRRGFPRGCRLGRLGGRGRCSRRIVFRRGWRRVRRAGGKPHRGTNESQQVPTRAARHGDWTRLDDRGDAGRSVRRCPTLMLRLE